MKTAYELAMERLKQTTPTTPLTDDQKRELAELDSVYKAKIAERELMVQSELMKARSSMDMQAIEQLERQLISDRKSLNADLEEKKEKIRQRKS